MASSDVTFNVSAEWAIIVPPDMPHAKKYIDDLSRYIGILTGKPPAKVFKATDSVPPGAIILLDSSFAVPGRNGFEWRAGQDRVEISGESDRGLCNGIYSFLSALGISWPEAGKEKLPEASPKDNPLIPLAQDSACEPSGFEGANPVALHLNRLVFGEKSAVKKALKNCQAFAAWAARNRYDTLIFPLKAFASGGKRRKLLRLKQYVSEYEISLEAGGWDLSTLVPRKYFTFHRDYFRMEEGRRIKAHHFCPTSPGAVRLIAREGEKLFCEIDAEIFHLWPDKDSENVWCLCPACRAFTPQEQNRLGVNAVADALFAHKPGASILYLEKPGESSKIPLRKNVFKIERLPEEKK